MIVHCSKKNTKKRNPIIKRVTLEPVSCVPPISDWKEVYMMKE